MRTIVPLLGALALLGTGACSPETQRNAEETAERAVADTRDNAEVVENAVREGAIIAADKVSEGADSLGDNLRQDERTDPDQGDGKLDGTD